LDQHIKGGYKFIYLGLIQVVGKQNYRLRVVKPILIILRDIRLKMFTDSIIVILKINLHYDHVFFYCNPKFSQH